MTISKKKSVRLTELFWWERGQEGLIMVMYKT